MRSLLLGLVLCGCHIDSLVRSVGSAPDPPTNLQQLRADAATPLEIGGASDEATVALRADLSAPNVRSMLRLEVEVRPTGDPFQGVAVATSGPGAPGTSRTVTVHDLTDETAYRWQARAVDDADRVSPWVLFGDASDTTAHFRVAIPDPPEAPTDLGQFRSNGSAKLNAGATTTDTDLVFKATVVDPDRLSAIRLEVEVQPLGTPFTNLPTATGLAAVASGAVAQVRVEGLSPGASYRWQARAVDETDRTSAWVAFGTGDADFIISP